MQIQIESTEYLTTIDGVPVRYWKGVTANGVECKVFIHRVAVHNSQDQSDFDRELQEQAMPTRMIPLSQIL